MRFRKLMPSSAKGIWLPSITAASTLLMTMSPTRTVSSPVGHHRAVGGAHQSGLPLAVVDSEPGRIHRRERNGRGARVHQKAHRSAVDLSIHDEMSARIGGERGALAGGGRGRTGLMLAETDGPFLTVDEERRRL